MELGKASPRRVGCRGDTSILRYLVKMHRSTEDETLHLPSARTGAAGSWSSSVWYMLSLRGERVVIFTDKAVVVEMLAGVVRVE